MGPALCSVNWLRLIERALSSTVTTNPREKVVAYKRKLQVIQIQFQINSKEFHYLYNPN